VKLKLTDLDPHFLKRVSVLDYKHTDDLVGAEGLQLRCPACHWADQRIGGDNLAHTILLWRDPEQWQFVGHDYDDLSLLAGRVMVSLTAGPCHARFYIKGGRVDFF
jgi:hypothetical protein